MSAVARRVLVLCLILFPLSTFASSDWQQPTPAELNMKSYAPDPDAPAVYLYREETVSDEYHMHTLYARIKILSEKGKEMFGDIEIPYLANNYTIRDVSGRTIQSDGTIIPFTGKPYDKLLLKASGRRVMAKVFSMPNVQVGSIIEYRWTLNYDSSIVSSPHWQIEQNIPVMKAHYHFNPSSHVNGNLLHIVIRQNGHEDIADHLLYTYILPPGAKVREGVDDYDLTVENIPAMPDDDYLPPTKSFGYQLIFYYSPFRTADEYWKTEGKYWSKAFNQFADPSAKIREAVGGIIAPGDTDQQKVEKIYAAVMKLDNTSFTRQHSAAENKAEGVAIKSAEDVWEQKRGDDDQITRLFVAMVRAAGLKAYGAIVVNVDNNVFEPSFMSWSQMDDELAIVSIGGKEVYFDPGQQYCEFARLNWKHAGAGGIRQTNRGVEKFSTPWQSYNDNSLTRQARLKLSPTGQVSGVIDETMNGAQALKWRQAALSLDTTGLNKQFDDKLKSSLPAGVTAKVNHFVGLTDFSHPLMVILDVSGTLGTTTGKHVFFPSVFFEAGNPPRFVKTHRENPVDLNYPYMVTDDFQLTLPANMTVESVPKGGDIPFIPNADYITKFGSAPHAYSYARILRVATFLYKTNDYPSLRGFFQKVSASDQSQTALQIVPVAVSASVPAPAAPAK